uniref:hypothetical protein n=1 Tax=Aliarcobacter sp. TaxID=2321116 RepID=UPI0040478051
MRSILKVGITSVIGVFLLTGCSQKIELPVVDNLTNKEVKLKSVTPFSEDAFIQASIKEECNIQKQLADFTKEYSNNNSVNVTFDDNATKDNSEYYLDLKIVDAISQGNPFLGHNKRTRVAGTLYKNGNKIATFKGQRHSNGGFGAGFKGSCSVLGRTVQALGEDIGEWIKFPKNGSMLGE